MLQSTAKAAVQQWPHLYPTFRGTIHFSLSAPLNLTFSKPIYLSSQQLPHDGKKFSFFFNNIHKDNKVSGYFLLIKVICI